MRFTEDISVLLLGARIKEILRVVVHVGEDEFVLPDTLVLMLDSGLVQLLTDPSSKHLERIPTTEDVIIEGDYADRTGVTFQKVELAEIPLQVSSVYVVLEALGDDKTRKYFVGMLLYDSTQQHALGITMHLDDIEVGDAASLWRYVGRILPHASQITLERLSHLPTRAAL